MATTTGLTIEDLILSLFPKGYVDYPNYKDRVQGPKATRRTNLRLSTSLEKPPCSATDLFAIAATLLQRSGAYHHIGPSSSAPTRSMVSISESERNEWVEAGRIWRGDGRKTLPAPPAALDRAWQELIRWKDSPVFRTRDPNARPLKWWRSAMALLAIADEAAMDIGFETGRPKSAQAANAELPLRVAVKTGNPAYTLSRANRDQVCVLPKSRTPRVGCTLRSLSHHLALLPPRGLARAYWSPDPNVISEAGEPAAAPFNLVVAPIPYRIRATAFRGAPSDDRTWGWFDVDPHWCRRSDNPAREEGFTEFSAYVQQLLDSASRDVGPIHALVLPEVALSDFAFRRLCRELQNRRDFELLISGLFDATFEGILRSGNFAAMARMTRGAEPGFNISIREKHHRWKLDSAQIETYALGSALNVEHSWWERLEIQGRSLDLFVVRGGATVTTLICEDLARSDPCQELVRGIGPNLVFALLMDGAQIKERWPARYATVLADDPGSSVLTLTSLGLVHRANETGRFESARQIGLWRDDAGKVVELTMKDDAQALCLSLQPTVTTERTLDGRRDAGDAQSWRLTGISPIRVDQTLGGAAILAGEWPS